MKFFVPWVSHASWGWTVYRAGKTNRREKLPAARGNTSRTCCSWPKLQRCMQSAVRFLLPKWGTSRSDLVDWNFGVFIELIFVTRKHSRSFCYFCDKQRNADATSSTSETNKQARYQNRSWVVCVCDEDESDNLKDSDGSQSPEPTNFVRRVSIDQCSNQCTDAVCWINDVDLW